MDLHWKDDLQVEGRATLDGLGVKGWTAFLAAPDHADRPRAPRPVGLDAEGHFAIPARPGGAKLILRSPESGTVRILLERTFTVGPEAVLHDFAFASGVFQGTVDRSANRLRLFHRVDEQTKLEVHFEPGADGTFRVEGVPAGEASFQAAHEATGGLGGTFLGWRALQMVDVVAGQVTEVELTD